MMINKTSHCCKDTGCHINIALVFADISDFTIVWKWGLSIRLFLHSRCHYWITTIWCIIWYHLKHLLLAVKLIQLLLNSITLTTCHIQSSVNLNVMFYYFQPNNSTAVVYMETLCGAPRNKIYDIIRWDTKNIMEYLGTYMHIWHSLGGGIYFTRRQKWCRF